MNPSKLFNYIPSSLKTKLIDNIVEFIAEHVEKFAPKKAKLIRKLSSKAEFIGLFEKAMEGAIKHFIDEYSQKDYALIIAIQDDPQFWDSKTLKNALISMIKRPDAYLVKERDEIRQHFENVLPKWLDRNRIDRAIIFFLQCLTEEFCTLSKEIRDVYSLQFQKVNAESAHRQLELTQKQIEATVQVRQELFRLNSELAEQSALASNVKNRTRSLALQTNEVNQLDHEILDKYFRTYKENLEAEINDNLVIEIYDKPDYEAICITPLVYAKNPSDISDQDQVLEVIELVSFQKVTILGEPGSGKTTALRKLCLDLVRQSQMVVVPVYVSLSSFHIEDDIKDFQDYIDREISLRGCPNLEILTKATQSDVLLLLDGWDEISDNQAREELKRFLLTTSYHFILTSRPETQRTLPVTERYEMCPLTQDRIRELISRRIPKRMVEKIMLWLSSDPHLMKLAENPLNLSIMTLVVMDEKEIGGLTKTKLYERAFETIIHQYHHLHAYNEEQAFQIENILQKVAYHTMTQGKRFFSERELHNMASLVGQQVPNDLSKKLITKLGILRDRGAGRMEFFHLWYQEFLTARHIVETTATIEKELNKEPLFGALPYVVGLVMPNEKAFELMNTIEIYNIFSYCRAIPEGDFTEDQIELLLNRIMIEGESHQIPVRTELAPALTLTGRKTFSIVLQIVKNDQKSGYVRRSALETLALMPMQTGIFEQLLVELLETAPIELLWHVIPLIGSRKIHLAQRRLEQYVHHSDPIVVGDAVWALENIQPQGRTVSDEIIESLIMRLSSENKHIQGHAVRTLGRLRVGRAIPKLREHLMNKNSGYRWLVPEVAVCIGGEGVLDILEQSLYDHEPRVIAAALKGISVIPEKIPTRIFAKVESFMNDDRVIFEEKLCDIAYRTYHDILSKHERTK